MESTQTSWPSMKRNAKFSSCHRLIPWMSTGWESPGWVNSSFAENDLEVLVGSKWNRNQRWTYTTSEGKHNVAYIRSLGSYYSPLLGTSEATPGISCSLLDLRVQERCLEAVKGQRNCYQDGSVSYKTDLHGEPEGAEIVHLETKSGSSGSYNYCKI